MSAAGPLTDRFGRVHTDLRVSVTDRCNLRCFYCMPASGVEFRPHAAILTFEEIARLARVAAGLGIRKLRLTGGEPLVRKGICDLVRMLAQTPGIDDLALTTNGVLLPEYAGDLKAAGLRRLNISLDTLDRKRFEEISHRDELDRVLEGIETALRVGFEQIKLNAVAVRGRTEADAVALVRYARQRNLPLRFIEVMPLDGDGRWTRAMVLSGPEILELLSRELGPLEPVDSAGSRAPATEYRFLDGGPPVGIVSTLSAPFCDRCGRLRLTSEGKLRNCLFSHDGWDARAVLRGGGADDDLARLFREAVAGKKERHGTDTGHVAPTQHAMHEIGG
ncbi:MAG: GTP 3',8-cyclase MoaA [Thermoguttaceae bacterium]|jgi:cyclic pyranopterin phosphate synthase|nr:GTP 3',8-cyclase MoaA [Thermoguttaceae bacterium]